MPSFVFIIFADIFFTIKGAFYELLFCLLLKNMTLVICSYIFIHYKEECHKSIIYINETNKWYL